MVKNERVTKHVSNTVSDTKRVEVTNTNAVKITPNTTH